MCPLRVNPQYAAVLDGAGLHSPAAFLDLAGTICSGHPDRHVLQTTVTAGGQTLACYLKREHRVPLQTRWKNYWAGFGPVSLSLREYSVLCDAAAAGIGCAEPLAAGEDDDGRAFLLVRALDDVHELRTALAGCTARPKLAAALGRALAKIHEAGFDHPDLVCKHVLVREREREFSFAFLDWQRARQLPLVDWRTRRRNLAALMATVADELLSDDERRLLVAAYGAAVGADRFSVRRGWQHIQRISEKLRTRRRVRELLSPPRATGEQAVRWLDGEAFCVSQEAFRTHEAVLRDLQGVIYHYPGMYADPPGTSWSLRRSSQTGWVQGVKDWLGKPFRSPEVNRAGLLFRLQKQGVACSRLLAFGQKRVGFGRWESFLLTEETTAEPVGDWLDNQAKAVAERWQIVRKIGAVLRGLHQAGWGLGRVENLCVRGGDVILYRLDDARPLPAGVLGSEVRDLCRYLGQRCTRAEQVRFLRSYCGGAIPKKMKRGLRQQWGTAATS